MYYKKIRTTHTHCKVARLFCNHYNIIQYCLLKAVVMNKRNTLTFIHNNKDH